MVPGIWHGRGSIYISGIRFSKKCMNSVQQKYGRELYIVATPLGQPIHYISSCGDSPQYDVNGEPQSCPRGCPCFPNAFHILPGSVSSITFECSAGFSLSSRVGTLWPEGQIWPANCFPKPSVIGAQPCTYLFTNG